MIFSLRKWIIFSCRFFIINLQSDENARKKNTLKCSGNPSLRRQAERRGVAMIQAGTKGRIYFYSITLFNHFSFAKQIYKAGRVSLNVIRIFSLRKWIIFSCRFFIINLQSEETKYMKIFRYSKSPSRKGQPARDEGREDFKSRGSR